MKYALVENGIVNTISFEPQTHPWIIVQDDVFAGFLEDGSGGYSAPIHPESTEFDLLAHSSNRRWEVENGGFELGGIHIASDDRSKTMITGARIKADGNPSFTTPWKTPDGTFTRIDAATIIMISDAMLDHVAACFDKEELVAGNISTGAITTLEQIDSAWNS